MTAGRSPAGAGSAPIPVKPKDSRTNLFEQSPP